MPSFQSDVVLRVCRWIDSHPSDRGETSGGRGRASFGLRSRAPSTPHSSLLTPHSSLPSRPVLRDVLSFLRPYAPHGF